MLRSTGSSLLSGKWYFVFLLRSMVLPLVLAATLAAQAPKSKPIATVNVHYASALSVADHFLQAWQSGDVENGMALLTAHAKQASSRENLDRFFATAEPVGYEITRGKTLKHRSYEFPVVLVERSETGHVHLHFSSIVIVNTANNDWAVDKLP